MAKTFVTNGTGSQQTLSPILDEKIPVYDTRADAEADLSNLEENQIIATKDLGYNVAVPVDAIENGNMHAVTSNAVYDALGGYEIKTKEFSGITNANGLLYTANSTLLGTERAINAYVTNNDDFMCFVGHHSTNGFWIKITNYDFTVIANQYIVGTMIYLVPKSN